MSIQGEIERIKFNVSSAYGAVQEKGGALPEEQNSDNLSTAIKGIPAGGGKEYTAGDGISIEGNVISAENPVRGIFTLEEFAAIPDEQKKIGTYFVADHADEIVSATGDSKVLSPKLIPSKAGKIEVDGVEYDYEMPADVFTQASASASSAFFSFASASSAQF